MNSLLQTLSHIPYFRKAVFHMPTTDEDDPDKSIPLALQRIFYKLQYSETSVSTKQLTKSFGWDTYDTFMQHDVQELNRVLCDKLEEKMKSTSVENTIKFLFEGTLQNYIRCTEVDYESRRDESFYDLQMNVKGCKDIYQSFNEYVKEEMLDGDNQYQTDKFGKQDARKGVKFSRFPPVLELHLKRFEYDFVSDAMVKLNDRFEFPNSLDLDIEDGKYLSEEADRAVRNLYRLHSVLVHSGGPHGGHYYAYVRPLRKSQWLKFDDERVLKVSEKEAVDGQFGGEEQRNFHYPGPGMRYNKMSNAYMLVYIRESEIDQINLEVTAEDIAPHLRAGLEREQKEKERKRKEKLEAHMYTVVKIATDNDMRQQIGKDRFFDLVNHDAVYSMRVKKESNILELKQLVWKQLGIPPSHQRYWLWAKRQNHTYRPDRPLEGEVDELSAIMDIREDMAAMPTKFQADLKLYLEVPSNFTLPTSVPVEMPPITAEDKSSFAPYNSQEDILLFLKYFDHVSETLEYCGCHSAKAYHKLAELLPALCTSKGFSTSIGLMVYEEVEFESNVRFELIETHRTLKQCELQSGDIICFQKAPNHNIAAPLPLLPDFFNNVKNRVDVTVFPLSTPKENGISVTMDKRMSYDDVCSTIATRISCNPLHLRLTLHNCYSDLPKPQPLKYRGVDTLEDMLNSGMQKISDTLFQEVLEIPLVEYDSKKSLKICWHNSQAEEVKTLNLLLAKETSVEQALEVLKEQVTLEYSIGRLRLMEVFNHRIYKIFQPTEEIDSINDQYWTIRAEEMPPEEVAMEVADKVIHVRHFYRDQRMNMTHNFGEPFLLLVREREEMASVRQRVQEKLKITEEEMTKWKIAVVSFGRVEYLSDTDIVRTKFRKHENYGNWDDYMGLEHAHVPDKKKPGNRMVYDKPVKIWG